MAMQFRENGCENCPFFKMDEDSDLVNEGTTPNFNGLLLFSLHLLSLSL
jgi:transcription elongation factor SPT4